MIDKRYDNVLEPFARLMAIELHANASKGDRPGWLLMSPATGMLEIYHHAAKLQRAVKDGDLALIKEYSADVANMSMMLLDVCGGLSVLPTPDRSTDSTSTVVSEVLEELGRATTKFPTWPTDPLHAMGVVNEEVGELSKAVLQQVYEPDKNKPGDVRKEAVQAAAMLLRFIASIDTYEFWQSEQHEQERTA